MDPNKLVKLIEILNVQRARQIVTWVTDPMHENTIKALSGFKTRIFDAIRCRSSVGQLSRVNNKKGMKVLCREKKGQYRNYITNMFTKIFLYM
nr:hypothetical protein [Tanacetum cinerariifolium]